MTPLTYVRIFFVMLTMVIVVTFASVGLAVIVERFGVSLVAIPIVLAALFGVNLFLVDLERRK